MTLDRLRQIVRLRLRSLFSGSSVDRELDDEVRFHLDQQIDANIASGMSADEARAAALRSFGGVEQRKEEVRDTRRVGWIVDGVRDLRHGVRLLSRSPLFATVAILSLGIGIGANVAMFSVFDALLLKKLPVPNPDGLVCFISVDDEGYRSDTINFASYEKLRDGLPPVASMAAIWQIERANLTVDSSTDVPSNQTTRVAMVTGKYFSTLGISAAIGRTIDDDTDRPVAVVSDAFWKARGNGDPNATAHTLHLNGTTYDVIGVMPPGFAGEWVGVPVDVWVPFALASKVMPEVPQGPRAFPAHVIARLAPGMTSAQTASAMSIIYRQVLKDDLTSRQIKFTEEQLAKAHTVLDDASRGYSPQRNGFRQSLLILMAGVALLLVVACANLANLLLARSSGRQRELAVRLAVGAGRSRIARQMLTESALIALLGGVSGLAIAWWAINMLSSLMAAAPVSLAGQSMGLTLDLRIDPRVLLFATAVCLITAILSGLAPALMAQRIAPASALRAHRTLGLGRFGGPSSILLIAQVAVSLVLLIGAGLFVTSLHNLRTQDLGLDREHELFVWTVPGQTGIKDDAMVTQWRRILERIAQVPGVVATGAANQAVLNGGTTGSGLPTTPMVVVGELPKQTTFSAGRVFVTPDFFNAAGARLVAGRDFTERDRESAANVAIISESLAQFYFGTAAAAVGRMAIFPGPIKVPHEIVGVVHDYVRTTPRHTQPQFSTFFPYRHAEAINRGQQSRLRVMLIAIRVKGNPLSIADQVRREIRNIDEMIPILRVNTTEQQLDDVLAQDRLVASLSTALSGIAVFLASLGLFGLLSYRVARRTNEIGVRLAFGATRGAVLRMVLAESGRLVIAGLIIGAVAATLLAQFVAAQLFGVSASDPWTIAAAMVLLTLVAGIAALIPARQAAVVDPATALRCD